ncbi:MAG TPA: hypothetical protein VHE55_14175 [Fimbriimonadaceae bacterium]|nr:hypothetical protein [Fimbriimonadaceae bacterium]
MMDVDPETDHKRSPSQTRRQRHSYLLDVFFVLLCLAIVAVSYLWRRTIRSDDAQVIEAGLLSFYDKTAWNGLWNVGDFVVIDPKYASSVRGQFVDELADMRGSHQWGKETKEVTLLDDVRKRSGAGKSQGPAIEPLASMPLDARIITDDASRYPSRFWSSTPVAITNRLGRKGDIRMSGFVNLPSYSPNGRYAILGITGIPWSMHSADVMMLLERRADGWKVIDVCATYSI